MATLRSTVGHWMIILHIQGLQSPASRTGLSSPLAHALKVRAVINPKASVTLNIILGVNEGHNNLPRYIVYYTNLLNIW
jgi:hypothetical protein